MFGRFFFSLYFCAFLLAPASSWAATCVDGGCHSSLTKTRYVHGPVAAEALGVKGCVMCHVPDGKACADGRAGHFKPTRPSVQMCQTCHARGHGSQHTAKDIDCLNCHDPHGSETSPQFNR